MSTRTRPNNMVALPPTTLIQPSSRRHLTSAGSDRQLARCT